MKQNPTAKLRVVLVVNKFTSYYGTQRPITCSQDPTTSPYPEINKSNLHPLNLFS